MLNNISWASYLFAISFSLIIYWVVILALFYRNDLQHFFVRSITNHNAASSIKVKNVSDLSSENAIGTLEDDQNNFLQQIELSIESLVKTGALKNYAREKLLLSIQLDLQNYRLINDIILQEKINSFIISTCKKYCSIHLSGDEVSALWK